MTMSLMQAIDECIQKALASGDLQPIEFHAQQVRANDLFFQICWIPALSLKNKNNSPQLPLMPQHRDANFNPFLPPNPNLTVGKLGDYHHALLNKYPICKRHLVIPRIDFIDQRSALQYEDFLALTLILTQYEGLGFYNGGPQAGASQHHLHVQWLPAAPNNASILPFVHDLDPELEQQIQKQNSWDFAHVFVYVPPSLDPHEYARALYQAYQLACKELNLKVDQEGFMTPMNLLIQDGWLLVVPRTQEQFNDITLNALSFAGMIYVSEKEQIDFVREKGVMQVLASVTV